MPSLGLLLPNAVHFCFLSLPFSCLSPTPQSKSFVVIHPTSVFSTNPEYLQPPVSGWDGKRVLFIFIFYFLFFNFFSGQQEVGTRALGLCVSWISYKEYLKYDFIVILYTVKRVCLTL